MTSAGDHTERQRAQRHVTAFGRNKFVGRDDDIDLAFEKLLETPVRAVLMHEADLGSFRPESACEVRKKIYLQQSSRRHDEDALRFARIEAFALVQRLNRRLQTTEHPADFVHARRWSHSLLARDEERISEILPEVAEHPRSSGLREPEAICRSRQVMGFHENSQKSAQL